MSIRTTIIQGLVHINEKIIFYPKLKTYYKNHLQQGNPVIVDVGSNKGQSIDFFLDLNPNCKIFGFEPNKNLYELLLKKYKNNQNIVLFNAGISDSIGKLVFRENIMDETSTFEDLNFQSEYLIRKARILGVTPQNLIKSSYEVDVLTLSKFIEEKGLGLIDVLKIDTEGHEYKCLLGLFDHVDLSRTPIKFIQLESHNDDMYLNKNGDINSLLQENKYAIDATIKHGFGDFEELVYKTAS